MRTMDQLLLGRKVLVTGATGLIGKALTKELINKGASVLAVVRDEKKAKQIFKDTPNIEYIVCDIMSLPLENLGVEYIVHGASKTSSKAFVEEPVETIMTAVEGTTRVLEFARLNPVKKLVYLSSMEIYGAPSTDKKIDEKSVNNIDTMMVRSSYPESKRLCECLCEAYHKEFSVPACVIRLTQTFGKGVQYHDGRVFAEFARCVLEERDIVLKTKGETKRSYLSVDDAVSAIIAILLKGKNGEAYNAANESTYCSILEMANKVAQICAGEKIQVVIDESSNTAVCGYAPVLHMNLDTKKLQNLGWLPQFDLLEMYQQMIEDMRLQMGINE